MEIMGILYFLFLGINIVSGFLVQTGSTGISNSQTNDDRTVQNLLNLIVNEQNSRLLLQNIVTTLTNKLDQLENAQVQMQKTSDVKLNQTENEMVKKLNEMSARLIQMEQFNADVSRQLEKEKNNREHLEEMYTSLAKRVNNLTSTNGINVKQTEIRRIETTLNNLTNLFTERLNNLTNVDKKLVNLTNRYEGTQTEMKALDLKLFNMTNSNHYMQDKLVATEAKFNNLTNLIVNLTNRYEGTQTEMKALDLKLFNMTNSNNYMQHERVVTEAKLNNLTNLFVNLTIRYEGTQPEMKALDLKLYNMTNSNNYMQDKLAAIETKLRNITTDDNNTHKRLANISNEIGPLKQLIQNMTTAGQPKFHKSVGFSVYTADLSSANGYYDPLKYQTLIYTTGNGYNMSTGVFTCEYPGLYFFTATMFRSPGIHESNCYFFVNNHKYSPVNSGASAQEAYMSGTQSMVYMLTVGDRVYLSNCVGVTHMYAYSSFSGFLISN